MCLLSVGWKYSKDYPLIFAGNRDEYHARPTAAADWWDDDDNVLGGRDLLAGGSWLAMHRDGRIAVVTNRPDMPPPAANVLSRGQLVSDWVTSPGMRDIEKLSKQSQNYGGFSLLIGRANPTAELSMRRLSGGNGLAGLDEANIEDGIVGLSNTAAADPWPKLLWLNESIATELNTGPPDPDKLFNLLRRDSPVPNADNRWVAGRPFIIGDDYGTRCSTVIIIDHLGNCRFIERRFGPGGIPDGESAFDFALSQPA